jgi:hypothetical protein
LRLVDDALERGLEFVHGQARERCGDGDIGCGCAERDLIALFIHAHGDQRPAEPQVPIADLPFHAGRQTP